MAVTAAIAAVASVAVAGTGVVLANKAQKKGREAQEKQNAIATARERRGAIREARIKRGRVINASVQAGGQGSSGEAGSVGSIGSQLAQNLSFLDANLGLSLRIGQAQSDAQTFRGIASLGQTAFGALGGAGAIAKPFTTPTPPVTV